MKQLLKDVIRWDNRWYPIKQRHIPVLQVLTLITNLDNETQQGTIDEVWVDVPVIQKDVDK